MVATGEDCSTPIPLTNGTYFGTTTGAASDFWFSDVNACQGVSTSGPPSPDLVFSVDVPAGHRLTASLNTAPDGGTAWDSVLNIIDGPTACGSMGIDGGTQNLVCVSGSDTGNPETGTFLNQGSTSRTMLLMVKGYFSTSLGLFGLATNVGPPAPGDSCPNAVLMDGGAQEGVLLAPPSVFNDYSGSGTGCASSSSGPDLAFLTSVPAGQRLTWVVQPDAGLDVSLSLTTSTAACSSRTCVSNANAGTSGVSERAVYVNATTAPVDVFAIVDGTTASSAGYVSVNAIIDNQPNGDVCSTATPLVAGMTLMGETLVNFTNDYAGGTNCATTFAGLDRTYSLTIPAGQIATITVTPATGLNTSISVVDAAAGCGTGACLAGADTGAAGAADTVSVANPGTQPRNVFVIVDSSASSTPTTFSVGATVAAIPANDVCETAGTAITASTTISGTLTDKANDYVWSSSNLGCSSTTSSVSTSRDAVYAVTIPSGQELTATVTTTTGTWNPTLQIVDGTTCANSTAQSCLVAGTANSSTTLGSSEAARFVNLNTTARTVFVVVDTPTTAVGDFSLVIDLSPPLMVLTGITSACDDMSAATPLAGTLTDTSTSAITALPSGFAFNFFGTPVTHFSANSNGLLQLYTSATGTASSTGANVAINSTSSPNGYVAALWDDLDSSTTQMSNGSYAVFGTAPNRRFTFEWSNYTFWVSGSFGLERLRFQAQLNETTNVVEVHYCSLVAATGQTSIDRSAGSSATVGLEDLTGGDGVQAVFNAPSTNVATGRGFRFTP